MSTSDLDKIDAAIATAQAPSSLEELSAVASAIPAAAEIARIANEFFKAAPGASTPSGFSAGPGLPSPSAAQNPSATIPYSHPLSSIVLAPAASAPAIASAPGPIASAATPAQIPSTVGAEQPRSAPFAEPPSAAYLSPQVPAFASAQIPSPAHASLPVAAPQAPSALPAQSPSFGFAQIPSFGFEHPLPTEAQLPTASAPGQFSSPTGFEPPRSAPFAEIPSAAYPSPALPSLAASQILSQSAAPQIPTGRSAQLPSFDFAHLPSFGFGHALPGESEIESAFKSGSAFYFLENTPNAPLAAANPAALTTSPQPSTSLPDLDFDRGLFDVYTIRRDFPILRERVNGRPLVWLDNAATTQKPQSVIDRISYFYEHENSNIHRAAHELAARATDAYEGARDKVRRFVNASSTKEIVFVRGATEAINLVAQSWGRRHVNAGDEIVISHLEHHANIVPWQMLAAEKGARLRVIPIDNDGQILLDEYEKLLGPRTRIVSVSQVSNVLGTVTPAREIVDIGHRYGARVLIDGAQAVSHMPVDVQALDCDFYVFSGHKMFAPTGIGVLYGKPEALAETPPWQGGGNMIVDVTFEKTTYQPPPGRFEAGTGNIADAVGLGAAVDYLERIGMHNIEHYEHGLLLYGMEQLRRVPGLHLVGTAREKAGVLSFVLDGYRNDDVGAALNREGIAVRTGHHCAQPALRRYGLETAVRPSLALYNTYEEIDKMVDVLLKLKSVN